MNPPATGPSDAQLDRLIGDHPDFGTTERESALAQVLERTSTPAGVGRWFVPRWVLVGSAMLAVATIAVGLVSRPRPDAALVARGGVLQPSFSASCLADDGPAPCRRGAELVFQLAPAGYSAFAAVAEAPDGTTLWFFPSRADGVSSDVRSLGAEGVLDEAVILDGPPGTYVLHGLYTRQPLTRDSVREALGRPDAFGAVIVIRRVEVQ